MSLSERDQRDFQQAAGLHQSGNLPAAIEGYRKLLKRSPKQPIILNLLGLAEFQAGQLDAAADTLGKALAIEPRIPDINYNLATVLQRLGRFEEALPHFETAIAIKPNDADARNNFGTTLKSLGRIPEAIEQYRRVIAQDPNHALAYLNLGNALSDDKRPAEAVAYFDKAIALQPRNPDAYVNYGNALTALGRPEDSLSVFEKAISLKPEHAEAYFHRGSAFEKLKRYDEAAGDFLRATKLRPDFPEAHVELGVALLKMERHEESLENFAKALELRPDYLEAQFNYANSLQILNRHDEAIPFLQKILEQKPDYPRALTNLGWAYYSKSRYDEARALLERSLSIDPAYTATYINYALLLVAVGESQKALQYLRAGLENNPEEREIRSWNIGYLCLSLGEFKEGWELHEKRFERKPYPVYYRPYSVARWSGEFVKGRLLAWAEQGVGDQILWGGLLPDLSRHADKVVAEVDPRLIPLFQRSMPAIDFLPMDEEELFSGAIDVHTPFASQGKFFRQTFESFPKREAGYLKADPVLERELRERIITDHRHAIGLSWRSKNPEYGDAKTAQLLDFESVFRIPDTRFIDLQYGETREERLQVAADLNADVHHVDSVDNTQDIDGLAALISACDAIITTSNSTAHLAGALGKPTWILLPFGRGLIWYWFRDRNSSPWYPTARLVRQARNQSWASVAEQAARDVSEFLGNKSKGS